MNPIVDCAVVVLAGGQSRRMGQDKANVCLGEYTLLQRMERLLAPLFTEVVLSVQQLRPVTTLPQVVDDWSQAGPLSGLLSCWPQLQASWVLLVACDMPFIRPALIQYLACLRQDQQVIVPVVQGFPQPLLALYHRSALPLLQQQFAAGQYSPRKLLPLLQVRYVDEAELVLYDAELLSFFDLDTPEALQQAQHYLSLSLIE